MPEPTAFHRSAVFLPSGWPVPAVGSALALAACQPQHRPAADSGHATARGPLRRQPSARPGSPRCAPPSTFATPARATTRPSSPCPPRHAQLCGRHHFFQRATSCASCAPPGPASPDADAGRRLLARHPALDSTPGCQALLVKRGPPTPSTYRVEELPQDQGSAWLFAPADTSTPGAGAGAAARCRHGRPRPRCGPMPWPAKALLCWCCQRPIPSRPPAETPAPASGPGPAAHHGRGRHGQHWRVGRRAAGRHAGRSCWPARTARGRFLHCAERGGRPQRRGRPSGSCGSRKLPHSGPVWGPARRHRRPAAAQCAGRAARRHGAHLPRQPAPTCWCPAALSPRFGPGLPDEVVEWLRVGARSSKHGWQVLRHSDLQPLANQQQALFAQQLPGRALQKGFERALCLPGKWPQRLSAALWCRSRG